MGDWQPRAAAADPNWPPPDWTPSVDTHLTEPELIEQAVDHAANPYQTRLSPSAEREFQLWSRTATDVHGAPPPANEYDLRGYWQALQSGDLAAPAAGKPHALPGTWLTPRSPDFGPDSIYHPAYGGDVVDTRGGYDRSRVRSDAPVAPRARNLDTWSELAADGPEPVVAVPLHPPPISGTNPPVRSLPTMPAWSGGATAADKKGAR